MESDEVRPPRLGSLKVRPQFVKEQRPYQLHDVAFRRVVRPDLSASPRPHFACHDRLEERTKDGRAYFAPLEPRGHEDRVPRVGVELGHVEPLSK